MILEYISILLNAMYYHSHWLLNEYITITTSIMNLFLHEDINAFIQIDYE